MSPEGEVRSRLRRLRLGDVPWSLVAVVVGAWLLAIGAQVTDAAAVLHHDALVHAELPLWAAVGLFVLAWQVMIAAMMLPSSLPLVRLYTAAITRRPHPRRLLVVFLAGYATVWAGFGALAFLGDVGLHHLVEAMPWLAERPWLLAGGVLSIAGGFQFTALKQRCQSRCRHPAQFLLRYYDRGPRAGARLGARHGLFCLGCCWALMLLIVRRWRRAPSLDGGADHADDLREDRSTRTRADPDRRCRPARLGHAGLHPPQLAACPLLRVVSSDTSWWWVVHNALRHERRYGRRPYEGQA